MVKEKIINAKSKYLLLQHVMKVTKKLQKQYLTYVKKTYKPKFDIKFPIIKEALELDK